MIKLKQKLIMYASGLLFLLTGCIQDGFFGNSPGEDDPLTFTFTVDGITTNSATRATMPPTNDETTVETLHLLFFKASEDMSGALAGIVSLPGTTEGTAGKLTMETSYILPSTGALDASGKYNIIGIANLEEYVDNMSEWLVQWTGVTEGFFRDNAAVEISGNNDETDYSTDPFKLLMNGFVSKTTNTKNIQMVLTRNVARFDIENKSTSPLQTVSVWNAFMNSSITGDAMFNYASEALHTKRFYGINSNGKEEVKGRLYAFSNYSEAPIINDKVTTCLIVGLTRGGGSTHYYRINVNSTGVSQHLKNNYAYSITINSVNGDGYPTEEEAWEGTTNQLSYDVNFWGVDDNGLIVSDEYSLLAVPVKTAKFGPDGGENSYTITTFSTLENPEPLRIKNQIFEPSDYISAKISNGNLVITALPMNTGETKRSGIITISYAGLETSVNVLQTAEAGTYLEVTLDDGWKEFLPPTANAMTENIFVKASGPWTARVYGSKNFTLQNSLNQNVTQIPSSDCPYNKFHVYTSASNESKTEIERGFVLISLDSDPTNYISVVPVNQSPKGGIGSFPENITHITFAGNGDCLTTGAAGSTTTHFRFYVSSTGTISKNNVRLTGVNYDMFNMEYDEVNKYITVSAKGHNNSSSPYSATISVSDNKNGNLLVSVVQGTLDLNVIVPTTKVPATGGESGNITITTGSSLSKWKATMTVSGVSRNVVNHGVKLYKATTNEELGFEEETNESLYVLFDKVYFPNRETEIKATVTITSDGGASKSVDVIQEKLTTTGVHIWSVYYTLWGAITNSSSHKGFFFYHFNDYLRDNGSTLANPGTYSVTNGTSAADYGNSVPANTNWFQFSNHGAKSDAEYAPLNKYFNAAKGEKLTVLQVGDGDRHSDWSKSFASGLGYTYVDADALVNNTLINSSVSSTRVYQFIMIKGRKPISNVDGFGLYNDAVNGGIKQYPTGAVPLLRYTNLTEDGYNLVIDPKNNLVIHGDETVFYESYYTNNLPTNASNKAAFMANYIDYLINAAKYGSHFTDMMIDTNTDIEPPYSSYWGANAWPN